MDDWPQAGRPRRLRALAERLRYPVRVTEELEAPTVPPPRLVIVQRGEETLAEGLSALAPPGVPVIWDRRERDRRESDRRRIARSTLNDRRRADRRRLPPAAWGTLRFLVVRDAEPPELRAPGSSPPSEGATPTS